MLKFELLQTLSIIYDNVFKYLTMIFSWYFRWYFDLKRVVNVACRSCLILDIIEFFHIEDVRCASHAGNRGSSPRGTTKKKSITYNYILSNSSLSFF